MKSLSLVAVLLLITFISCNNHSTDLQAALQAKDDSTKVKI